jgi:hypothetical protein
VETSEKPTLFKIYLFYVFVCIDIFFLQINFDVFWKYVVLYKTAMPIRFGTVAKIPACSHACDLFY